VSLTGVVAAGTAGFKRVWGKTKNFELQADRGEAKGTPSKRRIHRKSGQVFAMRKM
jgi:hypothetical protein